MSDYTVTGVQSAQLMLAETAKRIANYIREHPTPPKDFNRKAQEIPPVAGDGTRQSQSLGKYNGLDSNNDGSQASREKGDAANVVAFPRLVSPLPDKTLVSDAAHPLVLPDSIAEQVETANNVIQFFQGRIESLKKQNQSAQEDFNFTGSSSLPSSGLLADRRA